MFTKFLAQHNLRDYTFRSDIFPTIEDREFWDSFQNEECVSLAERELEYSWPIVKATDFMAFKTSGNRLVMEDIHFDRRRHLILFALAELKENKGRFLPQIVNGIFAICEESFWGLSAHQLDHYEFKVPYIPDVSEPYIDLFAAETAEHLALVTMLLRNPLDEFCSGIVDRVQYELERRIKKPYEERTDFWWMGHITKKLNNWSPWILSNVLTVFLIAEQDCNRKIRAVRKIMFEIQEYYESLPNDGGCDEGPHYWGQAGASLFEIVYQLKCASDGLVNLCGDEKLARIAAYMKKVHISSDLFVTIGDARANNYLLNMPLLFGFAKETNQPDLMNLSAAIFQEKGNKQELVTHSLLTLRRILYHSEWIREMETYSVSYPLHESLEVLSDLQTAALRRGDFYLFAKGGHNHASHNHNDVGSFTFFDGNTPVLIDIGIGTYTRWTFDAQTRYTKIPWTQACNHNLPMINGIDQKKGRKFAADRFVAGNKKIEISFAKAYLDEAGIERLIRILYLTDDGMIVEDSFSFVDGEKNSVSEVLISPLPVRIEDGTAILGEHYRISVEGCEIFTEYLPFDDVKLEDSWNSDGVNRIVFSTDHSENIRITIKKLK